MESLHSLLFTLASMVIPLLMPLILVLCWHERIEHKVIFVCVGAILGLVASFVVQAIASPMVNKLSMTLGLTSRELSYWGHSSRFWFTNICYLALAIAVPYLMLLGFSKARGVATTNALAVTVNGSAEHNDRSMLKDNK